MLNIHELTDEERGRMLGGLFAKLKIARWRPTRQELEAEIEDYLRKNQPCTLATCGSDGVPRVSVVDYAHEGLAVYIFSEGGGKFKNIAENNKVAVGIGTSARTITSVRGLNIQGTAEVFTEDQPEFTQALKLFKPMLDDFEQRAGDFSAGHGAGDPHHAASHGLFPLFEGHCPCVLGRRVSKNRAQ